MIRADVGRLYAPEPMESWIVEQFGSLPVVEAQRIVRVDNRWTLEGTLFNELRARRPLSRSRPASPQLSGPDPFADPERQTPEDTFGRIRGRHCVTASNVAKCDALHAVVIFDEPDPLALTAAALADAFEVAGRWYDAAHDDQQDARYPLLIWNSHPRAGASIAHAHLQLALASGASYGGVERWRRAAQHYRREHAGNYFEALYDAHSALGLAWRSGAVQVVASLTPVKEKELVFIAPELGGPLAGTLHAVLLRLIDELGVTAFNLAVYQPPLGAPPPGWEDFPVVARLVDRGDPASPTTDIAAMELFATSVVASDPFRLAEQFQ